MKKELREVREVKVVQFKQDMGPINYIKRTTFEIPGDKSNPGFLTTAEDIPTIITVFEKILSDLRPKDPTAPTKIYTYEELCRLVSDNELFNVDNVPDFNIDFDMADILAIMVGEDIMKEVVADNEDGMGFIFGQYPKSRRYTTLVDTVPAEKPLVLGDKMIEIETDHVGVAHPDFGCDGCSGCDSKR